MNRLPLAGKAALVTGGTKDMGAAIALRLARDGADVAVVGRDAAAGGMVVSQIEVAGRRGLFVRADVGCEAEVVASAAVVAEALGRIDIVVNNAAAVDTIRSGDEKPIVDEPSDIFNRVLAVGVHGPFWYARAVLPGMVRRGYGCFVHVSSTAAHRATRGMTAYSASKGALEALSRQIALDYGAEGIRSNVVIVGAVTVAANRTLHDDPDARERILSSLMLPRMGTPEDVAGAVGYLCGPGSAYITGAVLPVDGGLMAKLAVRDPSRVYRESGLQGPVEAQ
jgi:NAD(P)-dependent dehydrogenase (short-subunit alcohol dehydrogenase family)